MTDQLALVDHGCHHIFWRSKHLTVEFVAIELSSDSRHYIQRCIKGWSKEGSQLDDGTKERSVSDHST